MFYRVRRSLSPDCKRDVTSDTPLNAIGLQPKRLSRNSLMTLGYGFPAYELTWSGVAGGFLLVGGIMVAIVALLTGHWMVGGVSH